MRIHTFGESHAMFGWRNLPYINIHHIPATLCYSVGRDGLNRLNIRYGGVEEGDVVIYCFGEIDCRCQIQKYTNETTTYKDVIDPIVERYIDVIKLNQQQVGNITTCIFNVVPAARKGTFSEAPEYPHIGTDAERKMYVEYFNSKLREHCKLNNFIFIDVYSKYQDSEGYLNFEYSDGVVHINNPIFIEEFLKEHIFPLGNLTT